MKLACQIVFLVVVNFANALLAVPIRQPDSLEPGDQYRLAFVTTTSTTAESSDIETYNAFVQATADAAPLGDWGLEWKAIASTETVSARDNTNTDFGIDDEGLPIFLLDGTELVPDYSSLWNTGTDVLFRQFDISEFGEQIRFEQGSVLAWTGTWLDGRPRISNTPNMAGALGTNNPRVGKGDSDSGAWFTSTSRPFDFELRMYAMSEVLTAVPEPSGGAHFVWLLLVFECRRRFSLQSFCLKAAIKTTAPCLERPASDEFSDEHQMTSE